MIGAAITAGRIAFAIRRAIASSELIHLHSNGLIVETAAYLARALRKPYLITLYGSEVWHHSPAQNRRYGNIVRTASHRVFYSQALLEFARPLGLAPEPSSVIYAPVAGSLHAESETRRHKLRRSLDIQAGPLLLTVKRLHPVAGYGDLLDALPVIVARHPGARLLIAGEGELQPYLENRISALGMHRHVRLLGRVSNDDLQPYYAASDLFILASRLESWGSVMLEALRCGTPVLASDTPGASEVRSLFKDDVSLFPVGDSAALSRAALDCLAHPKRVGPESRSLLADRFSTGRCMRQYLAAYRRALADWRGT
jgi:glycosyltransferase involved in cell wall biosynthesis